MRFALVLENGRLHERWTMQAILSQHCLARWFERTGLRDHTALVADIAVLADADAATEKVPTPSGYVWLGSTILMTGPKQQGLVRAVRTLVIG